MFLLRFYKRFHLPASVRWFTVHQNRDSMVNQWNDNKQNVIKTAAMYVLNAPANLFIERGGSFTRYKYDK